MMSDATIPASRCPSSRHPISHLPFTFAGKRARIHSSPRGSTSSSLNVAPPISIFSGADTSFVRVGAEQQELAGMDGSDGATAVAEQVQSLVARIRREAEEYARLRLAAALLRRAIERYREQSQGPLVQRVDELFPVLTIGSFEGVAVDYDAHDEPVLVGVRDGAHVTVEGMSAGTRDQLYLALRVASLERYADAADPPPLIADDLFLNFDDERARAGLEVLTKLAGRMQVLFFTHHRHSRSPGSALRAR